MQWVWLGDEWVGLQQKWAGLCILSVQPAEIETSEGKQIYHNLKVAVITARLFCGSFLCQFTYSTSGCSQQI